MSSRPTWGLRICICVARLCLKKAEVGGMGVRIKSVMTTQRAGLWPNMLSGQWESDGCYYTPKSRLI